MSKDGEGKGRNRFEDFTEATIGVVGRAKAAVWDNRRYAEAAEKVFLKPPYLALGAVVYGLDAAKDFLVDNRHYSPKQQQIINASFLVLGILATARGMEALGQEMQIHALSYANNVPQELEPTLRPLQEIGLNLGSIIQHPETVNLLDSLIVVPKVESCTLDSAELVRHAIEVAENLGPEEHVVEGIRSLDLGIAAADAGCLTFAQESRETLVEIATNLGYLSTAATEEEVLKILSNQDFINFTARLKFMFEDPELVQAVNDLDTIKVGPVKGDHTDGENLEMVGETIPKVVIGASLAFGAYRALAIANSFAQHRIFDPLSNTALAVSIGKVARAIGVIEADGSEGNTHH